MLSSGYNQYQQTLLTRSGRGLTHMISVSGLPDFTGRWARSIRSMHMPSGLVLFCLLTVVMGCAESPRKRLLDIEVGMSMEQVRGILGEPIQISTKRPHEAWLYEYKYFSHERCSEPARSDVNFCDETCLHAVVWFNADQVEAVSGARSHRVRFCGLGVVPIDWKDMPVSAK